MRSEAAESAIQQGALNAFPVSVVTANSILGIPLDDVVLWLTLVYVLIQIVYSAWRFLHRRVLLEDKLKTNKEDCDARD